VSLCSSSGYLTNVTRCLDEDVLVFHRDLSMRFCFRSHSVGSPLPREDADRAKTRHLWPAITVRWTTLVAHAELSHFAVANAIYLDHAQQKRDRTVASARVDVN
jgi:hypothetical protein